MRVVDLRSSPTPAPPEVEARVSTGVELLRFLGVLLSSDPAGFDVGAARIAQLRGEVPPELLTAATELVSSPGMGNQPDGMVDDKAFVVLALLGAVLPEPAGVPELLDHLRNDATSAWRMLLAHHTQDLPDDDAAELAQGIFAGDPDAIARLRAIADDTACPAGIAALLAHPGDEVNADLADLVERFDAAIWRDLEAEALGPMQRDVAHRQQQLAEGTDPAAVVLAATNGYELSDDANIRRVVLLPSYWFRPWLVVGHHGADTEVISTVVADEFLSLPSEAPPPALLKLFKALSDEGRLKLLRRMAGGPISLGDASDELGVAKATAHHHLSILRQAGLVSMRGEGRTTRYAMREDPPTAAHDSLAAYVPARRR